MSISREASSPSARSFVGETENKPACAGSARGSITASVKTLSQQFVRFFIVITFYYRLCLLRRLHRGVAHFTQLHLQRAVEIGPVFGRACSARFVSNGAL